MNTFNNSGGEKATEEQINEVFDAIGECSSGELLRHNMNPLINFINDKGYLNGFTLKALPSNDDWTEKEVKNLFEAVKSFTPIIVNRDENTQIISEILKLVNDEDKNVEIIIGQRHIIFNKGLIFKNTFKVKRNLRITEFFKKIFDKCGSFKGING